jgi:hypothetical protein
LEEISVWGCSQLRRSVIECLKNPDATENETISGNPLDQLKQLQKNNCGEVVHLDNLEDKISYPLIKGYLDM